MKKQNTRRKNEKKTEETEATTNQQRASEVRTNLGWPNSVARTKSFKQVFLPTRIERDIAPALIA